MCFLLNPYKTWTGLPRVDARPCLGSLGIRAADHPTPCYYSDRMLLTIHMTIKCMTDFSIALSDSGGNPTPEDRSYPIFSVTRRQCCQTVCEEAECQGYSAETHLYLRLLWNGRMMNRCQGDENTFCKKTKTRSSNQRPPLRGGCRMYIWRPWIGKYKFPTDTRWSELRY